MDFEKVRVEFEFCHGRRRLAFACSPKPGQWPLWRVPHVLEGGGKSRWKSQNRKNVYLCSMYSHIRIMSKPTFKLNMVIKSFVPELRSRKCFSCFEIPMFYVRFAYPDICILKWEPRTSENLCETATKICH